MIDIILLELYSTPVHSKKPQNTTDTTHNMKKCMQKLTNCGAACFTEIFIL